MTEAKHGFLQRHGMRPPDGMYIDIYHKHVLMEDVFKLWAKIVKASIIIASQ